MAKRSHTPYHVAFIPDGNRRWAKAKGLPVIEGHRKGIDLMGDVLKWCRKHRIKMVSFWAFSTENFNRDKKEVEGLMKEFSGRLEKVMEEADFNKHEVRVRFVGDRSLFPKQVSDKMGEIEAKTCHNEKYSVNLFIGYGGRPEIVDVARKLVAKFAGHPERVSEESIRELLWTSGIPDPDLIIRTSGEHRTSGFLPFQSAYSELYFCPKLWPAMREADFAAALNDFARRKRRWGK